MKLTREQLAEGQRLIQQGYSACAVAMFFGIPVGGPGYYEALEELGQPETGECPYCGEPCFGTGDCNCRDT